MPSTASVYILTGFVLLSIGALVWASTPWWYLSTVESHPEHTPPKALTAYGMLCAFGLVACLLALASLAVLTTVVVRRPTGGAVVIEVMWPVLFGLAAAVMLVMMLPAYATYRESLGAAEREG